MARFAQWIKQAIDVVVDPEKGERVRNLARVLERDLAAKRQAFVLQDSLRGLDYKPGGLDEARETVYRTILARGWQDGKLTAGEQSLAHWVVRVLQLPPDRAQLVNVELARDQFAYVLAKAMEDGKLDPAEEAALSEIASAVRLSLSQFVRNFFTREAEGFLRGIFTAAIAQGGLQPADWQNLVNTTARLGLSHDEFLAAIEPQARRFVEHVLADAKADGHLQPEEDVLLRWLLGNLKLPNAFAAYVSAELESLRTLTDIRQGKLPSLPPPPQVGIRAGELVHLHSAAVWRQTKIYKNGPHSVDHQGWLTLTDNRLIFSSSTRTESWNLRRIVTHSGGDDWLAAQVENQAESQFFFPQPVPLAYLILQSAVAMVNQTLTRKPEAGPTRHIPRDVRQRVWQKYGGRCAECSAEDYLEFDHIVPVAKGGSNSDANVQLLCRRCNLRKSAHI